MKFNSVLLASIATLALVACGGDNDKAKPDEGKNNLPEKSKECIEAGDRCQLDGDKWVIKEKKEDDKPANDEAPVAVSSFDYSDIGVTDTLEPEKRGFGFWHKGVESPLNAKSFKNNPTQSPIIQWSSKLNYDTDLYNFVAVTLDNGDKSSKNQIKFMFDKIGEKNQKLNKNIEFFGTKATVAPAANKIYGLSSVSSFAPTTKTYKWSISPALVNTFMYRNNLGGWSAYYVNSDKKIFLNQEEDTTTDVGSGAKALRVYGVNAFLSDVEGDVINPTSGAAHSGAGDNDKFKLTSRTEKSYLKHPNFTWYKLSTKGKRVGKAVVASGGGSVTSALEDFADKDKHPFPTDAELGTLQYTQFGRLTGEGIDPEAEKIDGYSDELLKLYNYSEGKSASAGNKKAEDWYYARGTVPTPLGTLDALKSAGKEIVYDGQAVMFGIDYDPRNPIKGEDAKSDQSTNAVKPIDDYSKTHTLLDGKQNFVRLVWNPANGEVKGSVYGVWTKATYWRANKDLSTGPKKYNALKLTVKDGKVGPDTANEVMLAKLSGTEAEQATTLRAVELLLQDSATRIEPYINPLVTMSGKVLEGTNSFGGGAVRVKDGSKGLFQGAFFGRDASEVGGIIDSQTGNFKSEDLVDPAAKWGGAFGAQNQKSESPEDLAFEDKTIDYGTSTEFFTNRDE